MPRSRYTEAQIEEMRFLHEKEEWSYSRIGREYGLTHGTVMFHLGATKHSAKHYKNYSDKQFMIPAGQVVDQVQAPFGKTYHDYLKECLTKRFTRDLVGNIINVEAIPFKKPRLTF